MGMNVVPTHTWQATYWYNTSDVLTTDIRCPLPVFNCVLTCNSFKAFVFLKEESKGVSFKYPVHVPTFLLTFIIVFVTLLL